MKISTSSVSFLFGAALFAAVSANADYDTKKGALNAQDADARCEIAATVIGRNTTSEGDGCGSEPIYSYRVQYDMLAKNYGLNGGWGFSYGIRFEIIDLASKVKIGDVYIGEKLPSQTYKSYTNQWAPNSIRSNNKGDLVWCSSGSCVDVNKQVDFVQRLNYGTYQTVVTVYNLDSKDGVTGAADVACQAKTDFVVNSVK